MIGYIDFGMVFSVLVLGFFYMVLVWVLCGYVLVGCISLLVEICLVLGVVFGILVILFGLDVCWILVVWVVEGVGIYWFGLY